MLRAHPVSDGVAILLRHLQIGLRQVGRPTCTSEHCPSTSAQRRAETSGPKGALSQPARAKTPAGAILEICRGRGPGQPPVCSNGHRVDPGHPDAEGASASSGADVNGSSTTIFTSLSRSSLIRLHPGTSEGVAESRDNAG
jgi:hypothetical protein